MSYRRSFFADLILSQALAATLPPAPSLARLFVDGSMLAVGPVPSWENQGNTGTDHRLIRPLNATAAPQCLEGGPNGTRYVRFAGNDWLQTEKLIGVSDADSFALACVLRVPDNGARNLFGFGVGDPGRLYDFYAYQGEITLHRYGGVEAMVGRPLEAGKWVVLYAQNSAAGHLTRLNGIETTVPQANPFPGVFNVGGGAYEALNRGVDIAEMQFFNLLPTAAQKAGILQTLATKYNLTA